MFDFRDSLIAVERLLMLVMADGARGKNPNEPVRTKLQ
jgi:hypothetical protein